MQQTAWSLGLETHERIPCTIFTVSRRFAPNGQIHSVCRDEAILEGMEPVHIEQRESTHIISFGTALYVPREAIKRLFLPKPGLINPLNATLQTAQCQLPRC